MPKKLPRGIPEEGSRLPSQAFGENLMIARTLRRLSQPALAERMNWLGFPGWRQTTVSQVERGRRTVDIDELWSLALALNTTISFLLDPTAVEPGAERGLPNIYVAESPVPPVNPYTMAHFLLERGGRTGYPPWPENGAYVEFTDILDDDGEPLGALWVKVHDPEPDERRKEEA